MLRYNKVVYSCDAKFRRKDKTAHQAIGILKHFVTEEGFDVEEKSWTQSSNKFFSTSSLLDEPHKLYPKWA